jgi:hypothetical protein
LRQHERQTQADRKLEDRLRGFVVSEPSVRHLIYVPPAGNGAAVSPR